MGNSCKGGCIRYKAYKHFGISRYKDGQKRCSVCDIFIKYNNVCCPCCGSKLRDKPRSGVLKEKLRNNG